MSQRAAASASDPPRTAGSSANARVFFAFPVEGSLRTRMAQLALCTAEAVSGRAISGENLHATLAFIGTVPRAAIPRLMAIGDAQHGESFVLILDTAGSFRHAGVAWIGPSVLPPALVAQHAAMVRDLSGAGFQIESRPYHPHVTLARHCRHFAGAGVAAIAWPVRHLVLYESVTAAEGVSYESRARWELAG